MKIETIPKPLPEHMEELLNKYKRLIADEQAAYQRRCEPYFRIIAEIETQRQVAHILVPETDAERDALLKRIGA